MNKVQKFKEQVKRNRKKYGAGALALATIAGYNYPAISETIRAVLTALPLFGM